MTTKKKAVLKKTIAGWLCFAALTSGVVVPANLPSVFPSITAAAEEASAVVKGTINLSNLAGYLANPSELPDGVTIAKMEQFGDAVEITISESGTYKLTGSNKVGEAYFDLSIKITGDAVVTLDCDNVFIKNDYGPHTANASSELPNDTEYTENYSGFYIYNYVTPFKTEDSAQLTIKGKLYADTAFAVNSDNTGRLAAPLYNGNNIHFEYDNNIQNVVYYEKNSDNGKFIDKNYCLQLRSGSDAYDIRDYIDTDKYQCISVQQNVGSEGEQKYQFIMRTDIILNNEHVIGDNGICSQCNETFTTHTVTIDNGSGTPTTKTVVEGKTIEEPEAPTAPIGKKFDCWVDENGNKFNFTLPINEDISIQAKFTDSPIKSVVVVTEPTNKEYKEGDKFDPTGLKIMVTYDDDRSEEIEYNESTKDKFTFSPALDTELSPNDTITVTYGYKAVGGSNTLNIPITVEAKKVTGIAIKTEPTKTTYIEGEKFDPTGLVLTVTYENDETKDIEYGTYNSSNFTVIPSGALSESDTYVTIAYGGKSVTVDVTVKPSEGNFGGAKIDMPIEDLINAVLDDDDRVLIEQGVDISVLMATVTIDPEEVPEIDKSAINSVLDDFTIGCYIDVALFKRYSNGNPDKPVTDPSSPITISFELPQYILDMYPDDEYEYTLFCSHNGSGYEVDSWYDPITHIMSFSSDKFSTYALGVRETEPETPSHSHEYGRTWESDDTFHWHECKCGDKADIAAHISDNGVVTLQPTETSEGIMTYSCSVCGHILRTETIPASVPEHTHSYSTEWETDSTSHWHECSCGDKTDMGQHISNGGIVTVQPTAYTTGVRTYSCSICGYILRTETIPATGFNGYPYYFPPVTTTSVFTTAPEVEAEVNGSTVTLKWNEIKNADNYYVYQYKDGKYVRVKTTTDTSVTFKNLKNGETYKFLVRYTINGKLSPTAYSSTFTVKVYYKPLPKATSTKDSVKLIWNAVPEAEKYAIYKYVDGKAVKLAETEKRAVNIRNLTPDTEYKYIVRAYVDGKWTTMLKSDIVTVKTKAE